MTLKFVVRNLKKRIFLNLIKVVGLGLALSSVLLIVLFLKNELIFERFHKKSDRIYRYTTVNPNFLGGKEFARAYNVQFFSSISDYFPEVENYVRLAPTWGIVKKEGKVIKVNQSFICDTSYFNVFDTEILIGDATATQGSLYISQSLSKRIYGDVNPVGQILEIPIKQRGAKTANVMISGVMKDYPQNSHFHPEMLYFTSDNEQFNHWAFSYLLLSKNSNPNNITNGFKEFLAEISGENLDEILTTAHLQKISDIHLSSHKLREIEANGNKINVFVLAIAAFILLLISISNYISLNIGMSSFSKKYFSVNKLLGSSPWMEIKYYLSEGLIILFLSIILTFLIAVPTHQLIQKSFSINLFTGNTALMLLIIAAFGMLTLFSGVLPVFRQISTLFKTKFNLNNQTLPNQKGISKSLIVLQYSFSVILIVAVFVISLQTNFVLNNSLGNQSDSIICIDNPKSGQSNNTFETFKSEVQKLSTVKSISAIFEEFGGETNDMFSFELEGFVSDDTKNEKSNIPVFACDHDFIRFFDIELIAGRDFSKTNIDNEGSGEYILNESAMHLLYPSNPEDVIGKKFGFIDVYGGVHIPKGEIIGVVKDFHLSSMKNKVRPLVLFKTDGLWLSSFVINSQPELKEIALADIKKIWEKLFPEDLFEYEYGDAMYKKVYKLEVLQTKLLTTFSIISIFICSIGLLGLSLLVTQRRTKEVGIRKVNGAKTNEIVKLLNWDFIKWVFIAYIIAIPIAYLVMNKWLESFAYKITLTWWIFGLAGITIIGISLLTVSWESWKTANSNPVKALRYE